MKSVLILSKWPNVSGRAPIAERVLARGLNPVRICPFPDEHNSDQYADQVLFDWDTETFPALFAELERRGIDPIAVVNMAEPLIPAQIAVAKHYGLPGGNAGYGVLHSKTEVRERMRDLGLSTIRFAGDPAEVDFFPAIVKPARSSSASWLVRRVNNPDELAAYGRHLAELGEADTEMITEEYLPGVEFSVDGPVIGGRFHPVMSVEKPEHDEVRHHDAGLRIHPPQRDYVRAGACALSEALDKLSADLELDQLWLHVEGRSDPDGRTELVEINPRPGGGMYLAAIREVTGIDPIEAVISMSLGEFEAPSHSGPLRDGPIVGWIDVEADELGTVEITTTADDVRALPGVIDVEVANGYQVVSMEKENYFLRFAIVADSVPQLRDRIASVETLVDYRIVPPAPAE